ncbi:MAG: hypothetical protein PHS37_03965 [Candidatus Omnitrophica bacterium]|nr:hypothetical protein [Candidatus Omnitrophota bacterium]
MRKVLVLALICMFILSYAGFAAQNKPLTNLKTGLDNVVTGQVELPDNVNQYNSKGAPAFEKTTASHTKDDVGRAIVKTVGGLWQVATFWYPKEDAAAAPAAKK